MILGVSVALPYPIVEPDLSEIEVREPAGESRVVVEEKTTEERVREYFSDIPIMIKISWCESRWRQFNDDGSVLRGIQNPKDVGVMQINEYYHLEASKKLGLDIHTLEGNMAYARHLYEQNGVRDWGWSKHCWSTS